ncbi:MAG TPA: hypothetical protein VFM41_05705 [Gaiella sp.]|nr:hypothetical protein [Gaiella sp.]
MALAEELQRIASAAGALGDGRRLTAVLATEPAAGALRYLCSFEDEEGARTWAVLDDDGTLLRERRDVRDAVSIAVLCEIAEEAAFPGDLDELRRQLVALRITENPEGIDEAEDAASALQTVIGAPPTVSTPARLDAIGEAARRLEQALDPTGPSPFTTAMRSAVGVADALARDVESAYLGPLQ